ncbi:phage portal protein [Canibacter zhoujuaniae]|uniref:phage portal protein n=1 Tax=Canibacter zhoujuaniae TaxID=2708343 RepID=UPI00142494B9|nr:phage portal protein [Canibacter zhoujuaniae]
MFNRQRKLYAAAQSLAPAHLPSVSPYGSNQLVRLTLKEVFDEIETITINRERAMQLPAVARGRNIITGQIAHLPLLGYRGSAKLEQQPDFLRMLERGRPQSVTLAWIVDALLFNGRAFLQIIDRDNNGRPTSFRFVPSWLATVDPQTAELTHVAGSAVRRGSWIRIDSPNEGLLVTGEKVLRDMVGLEEATRKIIRNPLPQIELHQNSGEQMTSEEVRALIDQWAAARQGRNGGIAYSNQTLETKVHETPVANLLIEARNDFTLNIARMMNLPAWALDAQTEGANLTYSNVPSRTRELIDYTLTPYMDAIAGRLSLDDVMPRGQWCAFDTSKVLQGSFNERMQGYATAIGAGIYTPGEVRALETGVPLEAGEPKNE